jgi:GMP synthase-like glutamine amidotransferase
MRFLVVQHLPIEPAAKLAELLREAGHTMLVCHAQDEPIPTTLSGYDGLIVMGGPQSANDAHLPHIAAELALLKLAIDEDFPVLGICLGAQLLARAAGGRIGRAPIWELGWFPVFPTPASGADPLFSPLPETGLCVFQWHGETFSLPESGQLLAHHPNVPSQAFRLGSCQYGLQFHVEVDAPKIESWIEAGDSERKHLGNEGIADIRNNLDRVAPMHAFCTSLMQAWLGLAQDRASD